MLRTMGTTKMNRMNLLTVGFCNDMQAKKPEIYKNSEVRIFLNFGFARLVQLTSVTGSFSSLYVKLTYL